MKALKADDTSVAPLWSIDAGISTAAPPVDPEPPDPEPVDPVLVEVAPPDPAPVVEVAAAEVVVAGTVDPVLVGELEDVDPLLPDPVVDDDPDDGEPVARLAPGSAAQLPATKLHESRTAIVAKRFTALPG